MVFVWFFCVSIYIYICVHMLPRIAHRRHAWCCKCTGIYTCLVCALLLSHWYPYILSTVLFPLYIYIYNIYVCIYNMIEYRVEQRVNLVSRIADCGEMRVFEQLSLSRFPYSVVSGVPLAHLRHLILYYMCMYSIRMYSSCTPRASHIAVQPPLFYSCPRTVRVYRRVEKRAVTLLADIIPHTCCTK